MRGQVLLAGLLPFAVSALVAWQAGQLPLSGPVIAPDSKPVDCKVPLKFKVAFQTYKGPVPGLTPISESVQSNTFMENGWLTADTCQAGTLRVVGDGQIVGGAALQLQVALNSEVIWTGAFAAAREVAIPVPTAGHLTLGYFNDFYSSDYRSAALEGVKLTAASCDTFEVEVPSDAGGSWNAQTRSVGWLFAPPITLKPCAAGTLHFRVSGRPGGGKAATLEFSQEGRMLQQVQLSETAQALSLEISSGPLDIRILNPYFKEHGDRNLTLREIAFSPAQ